LDIRRAQLASRRSSFPVATLERLADPIDLGSAIAALVR
jgi:hypothetical protein